MSDVLEAPLAIRVADEDDVAVVLRDMAAGEAVDVGGERIVLRDAVPTGHKFAVRNVSEGEPVRRYRAVIGLATRPIAVGEPAELAVVDPDAPWSVQAEELASLSANTPYAGMSFSARVVGTVHGGRLVTAGGEVLG